MKATTGGAPVRSGARYGLRWRARDAWRSYEYWWASAPTLVAAGTFLSAVGAGILLATMGGPAAGSVLAGCWIIFGALLAGAGRWHERRARRRSGARG